METQTHSWTVVAAGPSLSALDPGAVSALPNVVAVNRAFYWLDGRCRAWCVLENPVKLWNNMGLDRAQELLVDQELWYPKNKYYRLWNEAFPNANQKPYKRLKSKINGKYRTSPGWDTDLLWSNGTTTTALALCCAAGAKEISLLGCDQSGRGGWGYTEHTNPHPWWKRRWELEKIAVENSIKEAAEHGVKITRLSPLDRPLLKLTQTE